MDPRRFVISVGAVLGAATMPSTPSAQTPAPSVADGGRPYLEAAEARPVQTGRPAITAANRQARAASRSDRFEEGVQVFAWAPGRVYEVWAAPLRVTALALAPGETLMAKAAGDTVRWQIGEARSGAPTTGRTLVLLKPLQRGLETNLVLTTDRGVYLILLRSGDPDGFNPAVSWDVPPPPAAVVGGSPLPPEPPPPASAGDAATPIGPLNARYSIEAQGRRAAWTPTAVFDDGRRTFIAFPPELRVVEAPALFVVAADGETQFANYRQADGLFIVDRLFDRAELRLGDRRPQVVRIRRLEGARP